jgi:ABC-type sugar transport system permease subunit
MAQKLRLFQEPYKFYKRDPQGNSQIILTQIYSNAWAQITLYSQNYKMIQPS